MTTYRHKTIEITFDEIRAIFRAVVNGKSLSGPSLDAIKKKIDAAARYEPFSALAEKAIWCDVGQEPAAMVVRAGGICLVRVQIMHPNDAGYLVDDNGQKHRTVIADTPEAIEVWKTWRAALKAQNEGTAVLEEASRVARKAIPELDVESVKIETMEKTS